jgi:putative glycosyltransferase (TIGR04348 family)
LSKPTVVIISPALANANNGNWHTADRWAHHLRPRHAVLVHSSPQPLPAKTVPSVVIALHARRSAQAIADIAAAHPAVPVAVILTGTDLYRDIRFDPDAQRSLRLARQLVVLQEAGLQELSADLRKKSTVIHQSARTLTPFPGAARRQFEVAMIGHLRAEKDPATFMRAAALVSDPRVRMTHIGGVLDPALGEQAQATQAACPRYRWLGPMPHARTRQRLKRCALMAIASGMEGGANVIIEAVTCGVPVLASDISGNRGMLGDDYAGYFPPGDAAALAALIDRAAGDAAFYARLQAQCALRAPLFSPEHERAAVLRLVDNLLSR